MHLSRVVAAGILASALLLGACSSSPSAGSLQQSGSQTTLTVPAMWAGKDAAGTPVGGIEPAGITIDRSGPPGFELKLETIEAQGAGAMWEAATASAAMVATLYSAVDPASISMDFTITGPIDGPSAGGILTVGLLAALRGQGLLPGVTMTGTITPEGSLGPVGLVQTKIDNAAAAGFTTILIPPQTRTATDLLSGEPIDLVDYGSGLGVEVIPVGTIAEAYERFTGTPFVPAAPTPYLPSAATTAATATVTSGLLATVTDQRATAKLSPQSAAFADDYLARMQACIDEGKYAQAYGIGAFLGQELARKAGGTSVENAISSEGLDSARSELVATITSQRDAAATALASAVGAPGRNLSQVMTLPAAAAWVTYAIAGFDGLLANIDAATTAEAVIEAGRFAAEYEYMASQFFLDAIAVVDSVAGDPLTDEQAPAEFLAQYRDFLIRAGQANENYAVSVLGAELGQEDRAIIGGQLPIASQLRKIAQSTDHATTSTGTELAQVAYALTYYIVTATLTANAQVFGAYEGGTPGQAIEAMAPDVLRTSVLIGRDTVDSTAAIISGKGLDAGFAVWSSSWGVAGMEEYRDSPAQMAASWIGLNEVWYDAVNVFMLNAAYEAGLS